MIASGPDCVGPVEWASHAGEPHDLLAIVHVPHTAYIVCLYETSLVVLDQFTFLPVSDHVRTEASLSVHGGNVGMATVGSKLLLVHTARHYLLVFTVSAEDVPLYEVFDEQSDACVQSGVPSSDVSVPKPLAALIKTASTLLGNKTPLPGLENIESLNNLAVEDACGQFAVRRAKLSVGRVLSFPLGIAKMWVNQHTSELLVLSSQTASVQRYNLHSSHKSHLRLDELAWYRLDSPVAFAEYDPVAGRFVLVNGLGQVWLLPTELDAGSHVWDLPPDCALARLAIAFCPGADVLAFSAADCVYICKVRPDFSVVKTVPYDGVNAVEWLECGSWLVVTGQANGWRLCTRFGATVFDSATVLDLAASLLQATTVRVSPCGTRLWLATPRALLQYNLLTLAAGPVLLSNREVAVPVGRHHRCWRYPVPARFQHAMTRLDRGHGHARFHVARSGNQLALSCGPDLAILSPYGDGGDARHLVWLNFRNLLLERAWNIVHAFWYAGYLLVINRTEHADELVVLNTPPSQYVAGGALYAFDSDVILWRHCFPTVFTAVDCAETWAGEGIGEGRALLVARDATAIVLRMRTNVAMGSKVYPIYISVDHTHNFQALLPPVAFAHVQAAVQLGGHAVLVLLDQGDLLLVAGPDTLRLVRGGVERVSGHTLHYGTAPHPFVLANTGTDVVLYDAHDLEQGRVEPLVLDVGAHGGVAHGAIALEIGYADDTTPRTIDLVYVASTVLDKTGLGTPTFCDRVGRMLVLHELVRHALERGVGAAAIAAEYGGFRAFPHCLELVLYECLAAPRPDLVARAIDLAGSTAHGNSVYVRCLRKIEAKHWPLFFAALRSTPTAFMAQLVAGQDAELCYAFLIVYLDYKRDALLESGDSLNERDCELASAIIALLVDADKYEWAYELCRFIKMLQPTNELLVLIMQLLTPEDVAI